MQGNTRIKNGWINSMHFMVRSFVLLPSLLSFTVIVTVCSSLESTRELDIAIQFVYLSKYLMTAKGPEKVIFV